MSKRRFNLGQLFYNEKFLVGFSVLVAFIIWMIVSLNGSSPETIITIDNIPIDIELSQVAKDDNLRVFKIQPQDTSSLAVKGNSMVLGKLTKDSVTVTSNQANTITEPGDYELTLLAKQNTADPNYSIDQESLYPHKVTVLVDRYKEVSYQVGDSIKYKIDKDYFGGATMFNPATVTISGPESIMDKVAGVRVDHTINETLTSSKTFTAPITIYDTSGNKLTDADSSKLTISSSDVSATLEILKKSNLPLSAGFSGKPAELDIASRAAVNPASIDIAGPDSVISAMQNIAVQAIDFSLINLDNKSFERKVMLPDSCRNLSNAYTATVEINMDGIQATPINVTNFEVANKPNANVRVTTRSLYVQAVGPEEQIEDLDPSEVTAVVDLSSKGDFKGVTEVPVSFKIDTRPSCWIYGQYKANVEIS